MKLDTHFVVNKVLDDMWCHILDGIHAGKPVAFMSRTSLN